MILCGSLALSGCSFSIPGLQSALSSSDEQTAAATEGTSEVVEETYSAEVTPIEGEVEVIQGDDLRITVTYPDKGEDEDGSVTTVSAVPSPGVTPALSGTENAHAEVTPALIGQAENSSSDSSAQSTANSTSVSSAQNTTDSPSRTYDPSEEYYRTNRFTGVDLETEVSQRLTVDLIETSEYSRAGNILTDIHAVAVHYLANPGSNAKDNRDYFNSLAQSGAEYASCHFIVGLEGEIIQLIPMNEISLATNDRNMDTISIECCHPDESGYYNEDTYNTLVLLTAWVLKQFHLTYKDIIRHFDANGKICPIAFVKDPGYYYHFKFDVACAMGQKITYQHLLETSGDSFLTEEQIEKQFAEEARAAEEAARIAEEEAYYASLEDEGYSEEYYEDDYYEEDYYDDGYYEDEYYYYD